MSVTIKTSGITIKTPTPALKFGAVNTDRVDLGNPSLLNNISTMTCLMWVYPTALINALTFISKRQTGGPGWYFFLSGVGGSIEVGRSWSGGGGLSSTSTTISTNKWWFLAFTLNLVSIPTSIYIGDLQTNAVEASYTSQTGGSGTVTSDSAIKCYIGNWHNNGTSQRSLQGNIGVISIFDSILSLEDITSFQWFPRININGKKALAFWRLGNNGAGTQTDETGNGLNGTVTGATADVGPLFTLY